MWTQIGDDINGEALEDQSGWSASLSSDGNIVAIGANGNDDNGGSSGHVRVYENINGTWTQIGSDIDGEAGLDESGLSVSLSSDGSIVGIGAFFNDGNGSNSGHVRVYQNISGVWTQIGTDIDGEAGSDQSGYSVSLSSNGDRIAIGAPQNSSSGHVRVYDLSGVLSADSFNVALSRIYPNPATTEIHITLKNNLQLLKVNLYNQLGQLLKQSKSHTINVSDLSKGIYLVEIETNQGKGIKKVLIE
jgi:Flp pilus assembly pilin Flp